MSSEFTEPVEVEMLDNAFEIGVKAAHRAFTEICSSERWVAEVPGAFSADIYQAFVKLIDDNTQHRNVGALEVMCNWCSAQAGEKCTDLMGRTLVYCHASRMVGAQVATERIAADDAADRDEWDAAGRDDYPDPARRHPRG